MIKKLLSSALILSMLTPTSIVLAEAPTPSESKTIQGEKANLVDSVEITSENASVEVYEGTDTGNRYGYVVENGKTTEIVYDDYSKELRIDGQKVDVKMTETVEAEEVEKQKAIDLEYEQFIANGGSEKSRAWNPSYGEVYVSSNSLYFPYRETALITAAAIAVYCPYKSVQFIAGAVSGICGLKGAVNYHYKRYKSRTRHYSYYHGIYYNRLKDKNGFLKNPATGRTASLYSASAWWDPIRPY